MPRSVLSARLGLERVLDSAEHASDRSGRLREAAAATFQRVESLRFSGISSDFSVRFLLRVGVETESTRGSSVRWRVILWKARGDFALCAFVWGRYRIVAKELTRRREFPLFETKRTSLCLFALRGQATAALVAEAWRCETEQVEDDALAVPGTTSLRRYRSEQQADSALQCAQETGVCGDNKFGGVLAY